MPSRKKASRNGYDDDSFIASSENEEEFSDTEYSNASLKTSSSSSSDEQTSASEDSEDDSADEVKVPVISRASPAAKRPAAASVVTPESTAPTRLGRYKTSSSLRTKSRRPIDFDDSDSDDEEDEVNYGDKSRGGKDCDSDVEILEDRKPSAKRNASAASLPPDGDIEVIVLSSDNSDEEEEHITQPTPRQQTPRGRARRIKKFRRRTIYDAESDADTSQADDASLNERLQRIQESNDQHHQDEWARENRFTGIRNQTPRTPVTLQELHQRGFYCCPICYVEAYRRIQLPNTDDDETDSDSDSDESNAGEITNRDNSENPDIETSAFRYGPIQILESLDGGRMKEASAFCFLKLKELKEHLRLDHKVDIAANMTTLFERFRTNSSDGLVQRFRKSSEHMSGIGHMKGYWDDHNKDQANLLFGHMKQDRDQAQTSFSTSFPRRAVRIWNALRQPYCDDNAGDSSSDDMIDDDEFSAEAGVEGHLERDLLDREERQDEEIEIQAYVDDLERRYASESQDEDEELPGVIDVEDEGTNSDIDASDSTGPREEDFYTHNYDNSGGFESETDDVGDTLMGFGQFKDKTYREVVTMHRPYVDWCMSCDAPSRKMEEFVNYVRHL